MKYPMWLLMVAEIVAIIVFGALAYLFEKWWIALFAVFWIKSYSSNHTRTTYDDNKTVDETILTSGGTQDGECEKDI